MLDRNKPVGTLDGRKVTIYTWDGPEPYPVIGIIEGEKNILQWNRNGSYENLFKTNLNIINRPNLPKKHKLQISFYRINNEIYARVGEVLEPAIAVKEIEFTEGEGL